MSIKLNDKYVSSFIRDHEYEYIQPQITMADQKLRSKTGPGKDFLGWIHLPEEYDKEEFARIQKAAKKIQNSCDVLIVIGIGGS
ncbi:MAG: glucose-6-phosphate isomerase, partial [Clostridia bacterium]|nr:glucose-6-phosphate isomerase [Clostridia bacterium]